MGEIIRIRDLTGLAIGADLRASDADRDRVIDHLNQATADGRISERIYQARVEAVRKTELVADLGQLTTDLPPLPRSKSEQKAEVKPHKCDKSDWVDGVIAMGFVALILAIVAGVNSAILLTDQHENVAVGTVLAAFAFAGFIAGLCAVVTGFDSN